jgi:ABC-2 type transport system permease protein
MWLPGALGALIEKDLRSAWRDPALKATLFMGLVGPLIFLVFVSQAGSAETGTAILLLGSFVGLTGLGSNAFGFERRGVALLMGFPIDRFRLLLGKNLAALLYRLPGVLVLLAAGVFLAPLGYLPAAATIALATLLIAAAADNYLSILFPVAVPAPGKNPYSGPSAGGRGFAAFALTAALIPGILVVAGPFTFLAWLPVLLEWPRLWWGTLPLALSGAAAGYALLVAGAARLLAHRESGLLERILEES